MKYCKYCRREIEWVREKEGGKCICVDPEPVFVIENEGDVRFFTDEGERIDGRIARPDEVQTMEQKINTPVAFMPHWRTCENRRK